jgi:GNAT superfamily N-acetyltransferase
VNVKIIKPEDTFPVRQEVLRKGIPLPYEFHGDFDKDTQHFGYFVNENLVSVATIMKSSHSYFEGNQYQLRGMATLGEFQGKGIGSQLLKEIIQFYTKEKADIIWFNARIKALKFYEHLGFQTIGDPFEINYVGTHYVMFMKFES